MTLKKIANKLLPMCNSIVPKIAILTFVVSIISTSVLYFTFDFFIEADIRKTQEKKVKEEFYRLANYVKKQQNQLHILAHTAFIDKQIVATFDELSNKKEFNKWAVKYTTINTRLHDLDSLTIWSKDNGLLASTDHIIGNMTVNLSTYSITQAKLPQSGIIKLGDEIWVVAIAPIMIEGFKMGSIQFSRNISNKFKNEISIESNLKLTTLDSVEVNSELLLDRLVLANTIDGKQIYVQTDAINRNAIEKNNSKTYTIAMVLLVALTLFIIFVIIVRKETLPFKILESLFNQLDEAKFGKKIVPNYCTEAQVIYKVYNEMLMKLQYIKEKEIMLNQDSKLVSIGNLAARVSHDINNPLCVIRSISDIGRRPGYSSDSKVVEDMSKIYKQTDRCMDISKNLLNVSKRIPTKLEQLNLNVFVDGYLTEKSKIDAKFKYILIDESDEGLVAIDQKVCSHALDILITNALEANLNNVVTVRLLTTDSWGVIEITDHGTGFPETAQEEVFDLFFTTKASGNGIGLSNALSLVHSMGGTIRVTDARAGQVSIFTQLVRSEEP